MGSFLGLEGPFEKLRLDGGGSGFRTAGYGAGLGVTWRLVVGLSRLWWRQESPSGKPAWGVVRRTNLAGCGGLWRGGDGPAWD